jgi:hypothetical protein
MSDHAQWLATEPPLLAGSTDGTSSRLVVVVDVPGGGHLPAYGPNRHAIRHGDRRRPNVPLRQVQTRSSRRRCGGDAKRKGEEERGASGLNKLERRNHRRDHKKACRREKDGCARWGEQLGSRDQSLNM